MVGPRRNPGHPDTARSMHGDEGLVLMLTDFVYRADVRMIEGGSSPRFRPEPLESLRILGQLLGQELESHRSAELGVFGLVDYTHPTATELL
jgi:hypothetical protein